MANAISNVILHIPASLPAGYGCRDVLHVIRSYLVVRVDPAVVPRPKIRRIQQS